MSRTLIKDLHEHIDQTVTVEGWVDVARHQSKMSFMNLRDRSGIVQCVVLAPTEEIKEIRPEWVVEAEATVVKRPEKNINANQQNGDIELSITKISVIAKAQETPFEREAELNIETRFDYRPYTMRSQRDRDIFSVQATVLNAYRQSLRNQDFTEFTAPALVGGDAEGGAAVFKVEYYKDKTAFLATSPQLYKQIMVGAFERVFTIAKIFRAEKSATTRHLSELTQMDFEMGFIKDELDVLAVLEQTVRDTVNAVTEKHSDVLKRFNVDAPALGKKFPILTLKEAHEILGVPPEDDMSPEHERGICEWSLKEHGSDFVFITKFPTNARAFYTMGTPGGESHGFDLLFRGLEINSGAQRIHDYDEMVTRIKERGMDPAKFQFYLQAFKYGMPPHGGCSTGLERLTMKLLNLQNVKEASAFPRDMNRIDVFLSSTDEPVD